MQEDLDIDAHLLALRRLGPDYLARIIKAYQSMNGLEPDGIIGPITRAKLEVQAAPAGRPAAGWPVFHGPIEKLPTNRAEAYKIFGNPGSAKADPRWVKENIVECHHSHGNQLPGVPAKWYVKLHKLAEPYWREGLRRAQIAAPDYRIERFGGFVFRHMRHDPSNPLSDHAFGCAADIDPQYTFAKTFAKGKAPLAWSPEYFAVWPKHFPKAFVEALKSVGLVWGADWDNDGETADHTFLDPMHFSLVGAR